MPLCFFFLFVLINYFLTLFFLSLSLSLSLFVFSFLLSFFKRKYSFCMFMIHSNNYPYKHKSQPASRTRSFLSFFKFLLSFNTPLSAHQSMRYFFVELFCRNWRLYFPKSIGSPHCQRTYPRHHLVLYLFLSSVLLYFSFYLFFNTWSCIFLPLFSPFMLLPRFFFLFLLFCRYFTPTSCRCFMFLFLFIYLFLFILRQSSLPSFCRHFSHEFTGCLHYISKSSYRQYISHFSLFPSLRLVFFLFLFFVSFPTFNRSLLSFFLYFLFFFFDCGDFLCCFP